jgi:hypothetical protein
MTNMNCGTYLTVSHFIIVSILYDIKVLICLTFKPRVYLVFLIDIFGSSVLIKRYYRVQKLKRGITIDSETKVKIFFLFK